MHNKIADAHDNAAGLQYLWQLSPPMFRDFRGDLLTEWSDADQYVLNGNNELVPLTLPSVNWVFYRLSREEYQYLKTNFGTTVTIYTLDKGADEWKTFNATLLALRVIGKGSSSGGSARWEMNEWYDVRLEFIDLEEIA